MYEEIRNKLASSEYDFLRKEKHLIGNDKTIINAGEFDIGSSIIMIGLGGSYAYGTNLPTSDIDIRGIALNSREDILAGTVSDQHFEQVVNEATDTTIYSLNKIVSLLANVNPNTIEMLGLDEDQYLYLSPEGKALVDNANIFLSKRCAHSFGGYANAQLYRLNQKSAHSMAQKDLENHILNTIKFMDEHFASEYTHYESDMLKLYIDKSEHEDYDTEIYMDCKMTHYPLRDWCGLWNELKNTVSSYNKIGKRNKQAIEHDKIGKHMMHLVRLYLMCFDILEKEKIVTHRVEEHDMLMEIRNGKYILDNNEVDPVFFEMVDEYEKRLTYAKNNTSLPDKPNYDAIRELVSDINLCTVTGDEFKNRKLYYRGI